MVTCINFISLLIISDVYCFSFQQRLPGTSSFITAVSKFIIQALYICSGDFTVGTTALAEVKKILMRQSCMMSGQRYAQATCEESTELVTNRASVNPLYLNAVVASYDEQPSLTDTNLASGFSNLHLSSHSSSFNAPVSSHHPQFSGRTAFPNVESETRGAQNMEVSETRQIDHHLR